MIFERLDTMNAACVDRFASWFAYHLSNFQFRWSWEDWSSSLSLDPLHPKLKFIRGALAKCMRLSYHQRIIDIVPETFQGLVPEIPKPENKYMNEEAQSLPGTTVAHTLMNAIKEKCSAEEALALMKDIPNPLQETEEGFDLLLMFIPYD